MTPTQKASTILATRVKARLDALGMSAYAAALKIGRGGSYVRDILRGRARNPGAEALADLARVLESSPLYLLGHTDDPGAPPDARPGASMPTPAAGGLRRYDSFPLGVRHTVAAGQWHELDDLIQQVAYEESPLRTDPRWPPGEQWVARVSGPSMNEFYPEGTLVRLVSVYALRGYAPRSGDHVEVIRRRDGGQYREVTLKEIAVNADGSVDLLCRSTDPKFRGVKIPYADGVEPGDDDARVEITGLVSGDFRLRQLDL